MFCWHNALGHPQPLFPNIFQAHVGCRTFPPHYVPDLTSFSTIAYWLLISSLNHFQTHNLACSLSFYPLSTFWDEVNSFNSHQPCFHQKAQCWHFTLLPCYLLKGFTTFSPRLLIWPVCCYHTCNRVTKETKFLSVTDLYCLLLSCICCSPPAKANKTYSGLSPVSDTAWHLCLHARSKCHEASALLKTPSTTPGLLSEVSLSPPKKQRQLPSPLPYFCHYFKPTC